jgi:hypothetical protein
MPRRSERSEPFDLLALLDALEGIEYVVVGGVAAALHGAPRLTFDMDIVPATDPRNLERLLRALKALGARVCEPGPRRLQVAKRLLTESCAAWRQLRLRTRFGPLDLLWRLHDGRGYREIVGESVILSDRERRVRVLGIEALIQIKEAAGRLQDRQDVEYLKLIRGRTERKL